MAKLGNLSLDKKLLLYLSAYDSYRDSWDVPIALSQEGMSDRLDLQISNLSRTLTPLLKQELVSSRLAHVKGVVRRRRVYFLTEQGLNQAKLVKNNLEKRKVPVKDKSGSLKELAIDVLITKVSEHSNQKPGLLDIVEYLHDREIFDINDFLTNQKKLFDFKEQDQIESSKMKPVHFLKSAPKVHDFVNRVNELNKLKEIVDGKDKSIVVVQGIAGIGKSTLAAKLLETYKDNKNLFWYTFHDWDSILDLFSAIAEYLDLAGRKGLHNRVRSIKRTNRLEMNEILNLLMDEISYMNSIFIFDNSEKMNSEIKQLFTLLIERWDPNNNNTMLFLTRELGIFYDKRDLGLNSNLIELSIHGLNQKHIAEFFGNDFIGDIQNIWAATKGHPMFLEIARQDKDFTQILGDLNSILEGEIIKHLNPDELLVLQRLAVYRNAIAGQIILSKDMTYDVVTSLIKKGLVIETHENLIETHDLIKNVLLNRISIEKLRDLHKEAYLNYKELEGFGGRAVIEALFHLQSSGDWDGAVQLGLEILDTLLEFGETELKKFINDFRIESLSSEGLIKWYKLSGEIFIVLELWNDALLHYEECLKLIQEQKAKADYIAEVHNRIGIIQKKIEKWQETINSHEKALELYKATDNKLGMAKEYLALGIVYKKLRKWNKSREMVNLSRQIFSELNHLPGLALVENNIGMLNIAQGKLVKATKHLKKSIEYSHKENDYPSMGYTAINLAEILIHRGKFKNGFIKYNDAINWFIKSGDIREAENTCFKLGEQYYSQDELLDAFNSFKKGLDIGLKLKNQSHGSRFFRFKHGTIADQTRRNELYAHQRLSQIARELKLNKECIEHRNLAIYIAMKLNLSTELTKQYIEQSYDYESFGQMHHAKKSLNEALTITYKSGDKKGQIAVKLNLARVLISLGDKESINNSIKYCEEVFSLAEAMNDKQAASRALQILQNGKKGNKSKKGSSIDQKMIEQLTKRFKEFGKFSKT